MGILNRLFLKGLIVVLPVTLTLYVLVFVLTKAEGIFGDIIKSFIGEYNYIPGLGLLVTFLAILAVGVLVSNFLTGKLISWGMATFEKMPLVKAIYGPLRDLISLFAGSKENQMNKVVLVDLENLGVKAIGLVTRENFSDIPQIKKELEDQIVVYIPMSYMLGGFTAVVSRSQVTEIDIPVEKAIKLAITGWIKADKDVF